MKSFFQNDLKIQDKEMITGKSCVCIKFSGLLQIILLISNASFLHWRIWLYVRKRDYPTKKIFFDSKFCLGFLTMRAYSKAFFGRFRAWIAILAIPPDESWESTYEMIWLLLIWINFSPRPWLKKYWAIFVKFLKFSLSVCLKNERLASCSLWSMIVDRLCLRLWSQDVDGRNILY